MVPLNLSILRKDNRTCKIAKIIKIESANFQDKLIMDIDLSNLISMPQFAIENAYCLMSVIYVSI